MGVSCNCYTVFGVKRDYDSAFTDALYEGDAYQTMEKYAIIDGMGGVYMVLGAILFDSGDARWDALEGFAEIDVTTLEDGRAKAIEAFERDMPDWRHLLDGDWKLFSFVHYS